METKLRKYFANLAAGKIENEAVVTCMRLIQAINRKQKGEHCLPEEIFHECIEKYVRGARKYGDFNPATDRRDLGLEALQELIDAVNYLAMDEVRLDMAKEKRPEVKQ
jgi:hypothetical protein